MADELKQILVKLERLEDRLNTIERRRTPESISKEEMAAFTKVRDMLAWDPDWTCGINETSPCVVVRCWRPKTCWPTICRPCDVECSCGPLVGGGGLGAAGRFGGLGG